jgi:hypothetical protein
MFSTGRDKEELLTTAHLKEALGVCRERLKRAFRLRELQASAGGDVTDCDATAEVVYGFHGAVPHIGGEAVGLHGAAGASERRRLDGTAGARPQIRTPRGREAT